MRLTFLFITLFLTVITGCKSKSAFDYSQKLVSIEKSLVPDIKETEDKVAEFFTNKQYDSAAAVSQRMEDKVENKIKEVRAMDAPKVAEAENFKQAYLKYFSYIKSVYTTYREYAQQTTDEDREKVRQQMLDIEKEKQTAVTEMQQTQAKFAKANGFRLETK